MGKKRGVKQKAGDGKSSIRRLASMEKQRQALELRKLGVDFQTIADKVGWAAPSGAYKAVTQALKKILREPGDIVRKLELERLDQLYLLAISKARRENDVGAIGVAIRIMERRARLLGLDAPMKVAFSFQEECEKVAKEQGLDVAEVIREAEAIFKATLAQG